MPIRCLVVDDDPVCRSLLVALLRTQGEVEQARSGRYAVESVRSALLAGRPYDVITLDIMMPDMDGQAALTEIRAQEAAAQLLGPKAAKIFMTTALGDGGNVMTAFKGACTGYLTKPLDLARFLALLREHGLIA